LGHSDLLVNSGVSERARTDLTGDHLTRVQTDPQPQLHTVAGVGIDGELSRLLLDCQTRQARTNRVVL
jgi:hypothetical protein